MARGNLRATIAPEGAQQVLEVASVLVNEEDCGAPSAL